MTEVANEGKCPAVRPARPFFSSGPCAKRPGWTPEALKGALVGRSHRSKPGKAKLKDAIERTKKLLGLPAGYRLGIHPSWSSGDKDRFLREEIEWMEQVTDSSITRSRQHYIRFTLPHTYRRLLFYGIDQEFSMGYGSINGFRASVASSFYWYDLEREEESTMRIFPFCFMDANARYEQNFTPSQAMQELMHYYRHIRKVNGLMVTIWHNNFLEQARVWCGFPLFKGSFVMLLTIALSWSLLFATASYYLVELPILRRKDRPFLTRRRGAP